MNTYFCLPPLKKPSGGMAVLAQLAAQLGEAGYPVFFVTTGELPPGFEAGLDVPVLPLKGLVPGEEDRWIVPEGWPGLLTPGLQAPCRCAVFVQNWAFVHGILPENVEWQRLCVRMFSVSHPVSLFLAETVGTPAPVVPPALQPGIFFPPEKGRDAGHKDVRIAWMPRKNRHLALQVRQIFEAFLRRAGQRLPTWVAIENMPPHGVAEALRGADIFLATGFPEGFGLPPLEALACGALVAGFTGMGGWDYMRQALPGGFRPSFELAPVPWGANGFYAADGDVWGAALALKAAHECLLAGACGEIVDAGLRAAAWYSPARQREALLRLWEDDGYWA